MVLEAGMAELGLWAAFYQVNPFGEHRADLRAGTLAALFANVNRDRDKHPEPFRARDWMLYPVTGSAESVDTSIAERLRGAFAEMNGGKTGAELKAWRKAGRRKVGAPRH
jgi:hypothetical protein